MFCHSSRCPVALPQPLWLLRQSVQLVSGCFGRLLSGFVVVRLLRALSDRRLSGRHRNMSAVSVHLCTALFSHLSSQQSISISPSLSACLPPFSRLFGCNSCRRRRFPTVFPAVSPSSGPFGRLLAFPALQPSLSFWKFPSYRRSVGCFCSVAAAVVTFRSLCSHHCPLSVPSSHFCLSD